MKKSVFSFAIAAFLLITSLASAQSPIDKVYEKYAGQDGFTSVNISREMFQMLQQMAAGAVSDTDMKDLKAIVSQLNGLKVLSFSFDSTNVTRAVSVYNEFAGAFSSATYKELMTINEGRDYIKFLTRQETSGKVTEMVMLARDKHEVTVLSLTGTIDLADLTKLSKGMNIHGMENFSKMKQSQKK
jgi:hypothetical protein